MSVWVRHKGAPLQGDGRVCIAGPNGPVRSTIVDGAFEWPDDAGPLPGHFEVTDPTPEAREQRRREEIAALEAEAGRLTERLAKLRGQTPVETAFRPVGALERTEPAAAAEAAELAPTGTLGASDAPPPIQASARRAEMERMARGGARGAPAGRRSSGRR